MKKLMGLIAMLVFVGLFGVTAFADTTSGTSSTFSTQAVTTNTTANTNSNQSTTLTNPTTTTTTASTSSTDPYQSAVNNGASIPTVTIAQAQSWAQKKGFDVVHLLQKIVQPFAIIIFILSAFVAMFGAFGNSQLVGRGIWGMMIAVLMYAVVLYAPEIMDSVLGWLSSKS